MGSYSTKIWHFSFGSERYIFNRIQSIGINDFHTDIFSFHMKDDNGIVREVHYNHPKPPNFEDAEKIVVEGYSKDAVFVAENILVKCPSKYNSAAGLDEVPDLTTGG